MGQSPRAKGVFHVY